jgi:hypothetical protein
MFNLFLESGVTPEAWNESNTYLLLKDESQPFCDKTRPICLSNILRRIFEKLLLRKFETQNWTKTSKYQTGFKHGYSTQTQILTIHEITRRGKTLSAFLDLSAAYDKVDYQTKSEKYPQKRSESNH